MSVAIVCASSAYIAGQVLPGLQAMAKAGRGTLADVEAMRKEWSNEHFLTTCFWEKSECTPAKKAKTLAFIVNACRVHVTLALEGVPEKPKPFDILHSCLPILSELREKGLDFCKGQWPYSGTSDFLGNDSNVDPELTRLYTRLEELAGEVGADDVIGGIHVRSMRKYWANVRCFWPDAGSYEHPSIHLRLLEKLGFALLDLVTAVSYMMEHLLEINTPRVRA